MEVSAPESPFQVPGFRDRLGERVIVPQPSGALLEYLHFCDALASAPFFTQAVKDRVSRLSKFSPASYCRIRRLQQVAERDGRPALVSSHVAGRRLLEILEVAARADLKPTTAGVLAVTRQVMASVALLHDFAPDGFHCAIGPERLIMAGDGRVVVSEHVLGTAVELGAQAWGTSRLWREFRIAVLPQPGSKHYGRRTDVMQVGLVTLAMLLGRPLGVDEYPEALEALLGTATETATNGTAVPLSQGLRRWLERTLQQPGSSPFRTLLEAQKGLNQLLQNGGYGASSVAWDTFVGICETAAVRVPLPVAAPAERPSATPPTGEPPVGQPPAGGDPTPGASGDRVVPIREDPFGPWPVAAPAESAATLLDVFLPQPPPAPPAHGDVPPPPVSQPAAPDEPLSWHGSDGPTAAMPAPVAEEPSTETLFEAPRREPAPVVVVRSDAAPPATLHWEEPKAPAPQATSVADWRSAIQAPDPTCLVLEIDKSEEEASAGTDFDESRREPAPRRRKDLLILAALVLVATVAAVYAPYVWTILFEGRRTFGTLFVESDPPGAVVSVDGQVRGHTPADLTLRVGEHLLEVQVGGSAVSKTVSVSARGRTSEKMTFPEAGERGGLRITTYPTTGRITIDGVPRGAAPIKVTDLAPGTHTLLVETPLGAQEQDVVVQPGRVSQLQVPTASWLKVEAPFDLKVYADGRLLGTTGRSAVMVPPGRHHFDFVNQSMGIKIRQFLDAVPGQVVTAPIELPAGMMNLYADQTAEVFVDGERVGVTPLTSLPAPLGSHEVVFRHPKYGEVRYTVSVTLAAPVRINVAFRK